MSSQSAQLPAHLSRQKATFMLTDILRATSLVREIDDETQFAIFIDGYYALCSSEVAQASGEVVKYVGDACLAMFAEHDIEAAIGSLVAIRDAFPSYCKSQGVTPTDIKGVVHTGEAVVGSFGPEAIRDVMGKTINTLFSMESHGITISEQVYRKLPSDRRQPWQKHGGHVVYVMK